LVRKRIYRWEVDPGANDPREGPYVATAAAAAPRAGSSDPQALDWRHGGARRGSPAVIAVIYVIIGLVWIAFSDRALEVFVDDDALRAQLGTIKGFAYVAVTGTILFALIWRSEERLRRFSEELRATLDSLGDGVLVVSPHGTVVEINQAVMELTGILRKDEHLRHITEWALRVNLRLRDGRPVPPEQLVTLRALRGERPGSYDAIVRRTDGSDLPVAISASPHLVRMSAACARW